MCYITFPLMTERYVVYQIKWDVEMVITSWWSFLSVLIWEKRFMCLIWASTQGHPNIWYWLVLSSKNPKSSSGQCTQHWFMLHHRCYHNTYYNYNTIPDIIVLINNIGNRSLWYNCKWQIPQHKWYKKNCICIPKIIL